MKPCHANEHRHGHWHNCSLTAGHTGPHFCQCRHTWPPPIEVTAW